MPEQNETNEPKDETSVDPVEQNLHTIEKDTDNRSFKTPEEISQTESSESEPLLTASVVPTSTAHDSVAVGKDGKPKARKKLALLIGLSVVLLGLVAGVTYLLVRPDPKPQVAATKRVIKPTPIQKKVITQTEAEAQLARFITPTTGEKWYATPKTVSDLGFWAEAAGISAQYFEVGTRGTSTIYLVDTQAVGDNFTIFEKAADGKVSVITEPNANMDYSADYIKSFTSEQNGLATGVTVDKTTHYDSLSIPARLSFGVNQSVTLQQNAFTSLGYMFTASRVTDGTTTMTTIQQLGQSKLVKLVRTYADTKLTAINYVVDLPVGTQLDLAYEPVSKDLSTYTWNNGTAVPSYPASSSHTSNISGIVRGCGSASTAVSRADAVTDSDFVIAGTTADGKTVYAFKDNNAPLVQKAYSEYKEYYAVGTTTPVLSFDDFLKQHALVAYKDTDGTWLVYSRDELAPGGGCAKPVVYLYPTKTEQVNVKLGANVKISIPQYNQTKGWNVTAQSNGTLTSGGRQYDSLFWEGTGIGLYPGITSGTVVKRADAAATIRTQLTEQGLTAKESSDFMTYWQAKIPNKPYVRLTWFNTQQMNALAPLAVSPKPDTAIRVFLDMDGFDTAPQLPAQKLQAVQRTGFTVVEWGGLASGKLY